MTEALINLKTIRELFCTQKVERKQESAKGHLVYAAQNMKFLTRVASEAELTRIIRCVSDQSGSRMDFK